MTRLYRFPLSKRLLDILLLLIFFPVYTALFILILVIMFITFHFPFSIYLCDAQPHRLNDVLLSSDL